MPILEDIANHCIHDFNHEAYHSSGYNNIPHNPFYHAFQEYLEGLKRINYILLMENPLTFGTYVCNPNGRDGYIIPINSAFNIDDEEDRIIQWRNLGILPLDIYQFFCLQNNEASGVILAETIRNGNGQKVRNPYRRSLFVSGIYQEKIPYPVFRTQLAFQYLNDNCRDRIAEDCKLAVMMPQVTSLPIFNYYNQHVMQELIADAVDFAHFFRIFNFKPSYDRFPTTIIPRHKANTICASNYPDSNLLKIALDL